MDQDGSAYVPPRNPEPPHLSAGLILSVSPTFNSTLQVAAVGLTYEIIAVPHHHHSKGEHRADVHERRAQVMAIVKIFEGKLAQTDIVL